MSWLFKLLGNASGNTAEVSADQELKVALASDPAKAGNVRVLDSNGAPLYATENGALATSLASVVFFEQVDGAAVNTNLWAQSVSTMAIAQTGGYITLNSAGSTASGAYSILSSVKYIPLYGVLPVRVAINAWVPLNAEANAIMEMGLGLVSGTSAPTDGVFFRWNNTGELRAIISYGGLETPSSVLTAPPINEAAIFEIIVVEDLVQFYIDDELAAEIQVPVGLAFPTSAGRLPVFARVYNTGIPITAPKINIGQIVVAQEAMNQEKSWGDTLISLGRGSYQLAGSGFGQTANHANSTSPVSASLSNTAAGYTTLGGRFQFAAVGAAATDYALFAFQVPAGYQLVINAIYISCAVTGLAVVTPTLLDWALGLNASAVSLATADGATTWAPRRIPLGLQSFAALAPIAQVTSDLSRRFDPQLVVDGGRFLHVILQVPNGAATASVVFRGDVMINGFFE